MIKYLMHSGHFFFGEKILFYIFVAVCGLIVGSFCNVVIYRLPLMLHAIWREECLVFLRQEAKLPRKIFNLFWPRSHCPVCQAKIPLLLNIPLLSYILLRGKCRRCHAPISWRYPGVELLSCLSALAVAYQFGASWQTVALLVLTWALIVLVFIDVAQQILPDSITLPLLWLGLLVNHFWHLFASGTQAILGVIFGYGSLWLIANLFKLLRKKEGMGYGDFKLLAMLGAWLGWQMLPFITIIAALLGLGCGAVLIMLRRHQYSAPLSFGPYLAFAGWLMFFAGPVLLAGYEKLLFVW